MTKHEALKLWKESDRSWHSFVIDLWIAKWITTDQLTSWR